MSDSAVAAGRRWFFAVIILVGLCVSTWSRAEFPLANVPLVSNVQPPPLAMLVMSKDHNLFFEAYNDLTDIDGDPNGEVDRGYLTDFEYYGYFVNNICYEYQSNLRGQGVAGFAPAQTLADFRGSCRSAAGRWHGNFLNYLTTSRMDALRKALYGGKRIVDTATQGGNEGITILERAFIPQDAHSWGKEFNSPTSFVLPETGRVDTYDISDVTPLSMPQPGLRHIFAITSLPNNEPVLRVIQDVNLRVWEWVSKESPVATQECQRFREFFFEGQVGYYLDRRQPCSSTLQDYSVRVEVCSDQYNQDSTGCRMYINAGGDVTYKPAGLLQREGEGNRALFGLITGSYENNTQGGVLRKNISSFRNEIDDNGVFALVGPGEESIVNTLDRITITNISNTRSGPFPAITYVDCPLNATRAMRNGECSNWGNPIAEMLYESLRYFDGEDQPTAEFVAGLAAGSIDQRLGLPSATWEDPYEQNDGRDWSCARPAQLVVSSINNSFDTDFLQNSNSFGWDIEGDSQTLWNNEFGGSQNVMIGEVDGVASSTVTGAPTAKTSSSFFGLRGLSPEEPSSEGGYLAATVAYNGLTQVINSRGLGVETYAVTVSSPLPRVNIEDSAENTVTILPFAKSVADLGYGAGPYRPTNQIADVYLENITSTEGAFRVSFEDVGQGNDFDMDAIARYEYEIVSYAGAEYIVVKMESQAASGEIEQHMGYVIEGVEHSGVYLEVHDSDEINPPFDVVEYIPRLDTPHLQYRHSGDALRTVSGRESVTEALCRTSSLAGNPDNIYTAPNSIGLRSCRVFRVTSSAEGVTDLNPPLWYAAKYGGFDESDENATVPMPDVGIEWRADDGNPHNYFYVSNANELEDQLSDALNAANSQVRSAASVAINSGVLNQGSKLFQALFVQGSWSGDLRSVDLRALILCLENENGSARLDECVSANTVSAGEQLTRRVAARGHSSRNIFTIDDAGNGFEFSVANLSRFSSDAIRQLRSSIRQNMSAGLSIIFPLQLSRATSALINYLRGEDTYEGTDDPFINFRERFVSEDDRSDSKLGDIVNSSPRYVGPSINNYPIPAMWPAGSPEAGGGSYIEFKRANLNRREMVYLGANDGMMHAFDAETLEEVFAYIPASVYGKLSQLALHNYDHEFFVDGPIAVNDAFINGQWRTVLVGALGAGGQGIYALDITNPSSFGPSQVLWEFRDRDLDPATQNTSSPKGDADMGYTFGRPAIFRARNGEWMAAFGNGVNSTEADGSATPVSQQEKSVLYFVNLSTGRLVRKIELQNSSIDARNTEFGNEPNGLSSPAVVDMNGDAIADFVYAGDLYGNLWKVNISDSNPNRWGTAFGSAANPDPLFVANTCTEIDVSSTSVSCSSVGNTQPITVRPMVMPFPYKEDSRDDELFVLFGTGKLFANGDEIAANQLNPQTLYGIHDDFSRSGFDRNALAMQAITCEGNTGNTDSTNCSVGGTIADADVNQEYRVTTQMDVDYSDGGLNQAGWALDLAMNINGVLENRGERLVADPITRLSGFEPVQQRAIFATMQPSQEQCEDGGTGWFMEIDAYTGQPLPISPFDFSGDELSRPDGGFDRHDEVFDEVGNERPASGKKSLDGIPTAPTIVIDPESGTERKFSSTSSGEIKTFIEHPGFVTGRRSWREIRPD